MSLIELKQNFENFEVGAKMLQYYEKNEAISLAVYSTVGVKRMTLTN